MIGVLLQAALVAKLLLTRLHKPYASFLVYLCAGVVQAGLLMLVPARTNRYAWVFLVSQPVIWLLSVLVVLELYSMALRKHPGIATLSRWVLSASMVLAAGIASLSLSADLSRPAGAYRTLVYFSVIERGIVSSLVLFLLMITVFLVLFPISIRRNTVLHATVLSIHFLSVALGLFLRNVAGYQITAAINTSLICVDCVCFVLWLAWLNRAGEEGLVVVRSRWQPEDEERLLRHLDALSDSLRRTGDR
ncbi:MAG: hypothetical protein ACE141_05685 [Bryobacteraceae bacterium]